MLKIPIIGLALIIGIIGISLLFSGGCVLCRFLKESYWSSSSDTTLFIISANGYVIEDKWIPYIGLAEVISGLLIIYIAYFVFMCVKNNSGE